MVMSSTGKQIARQGGLGMQDMNGFSAEEMAMLLPLFTGSSTGYLEQFREALGRVASGDDDEPTLEVVEAGRPWSFDANGELLRLASEAYRINLAWLFDPFVAAYDPAGREVGTFDELHEVVGRGMRVVDQVDTGLAHFRQVVRRTARSHPHGDASLIV